MSDLMLDVDQAGELKAAFRRGNWTNAEIKRACEGDFLARVREVLLDRAEIKKAQHTIDCDSDPFVPEGWKVEEHKKGGQFTFDPTKIKLYLSENQIDGKYIEGNKLREEILKVLTKEGASMPVLNANVLDYLFKNPQLIPEEWKEDNKGNIRYIFFWGTIYRLSGGLLCVRCLFFLGGEWRWRYFWLGLDWDGVDPAASLAS